MTTDALNTQNNSALAVINVGADYILPVKENHPGLLADIQLLFSEAIVCNAQSSNNTNKKLVNS